MLASGPGPGYKSPSATAMPSLGLTAIGEGEALAGSSERIPHGAFLENGSSVSETPLIATPEAPAALSRGQIHLAIGIALLTLGLGLLRGTPGVIGAYHDDGVYVATAKALADGRGYIQPFLPEPLPETKYPPLVPALFAMIWKAFPRFPDNAILFQACSLLALALSNALGYLFLIRFRYAGPGAALVAAGLVVSSPTVLYYGTIPLSEAFFSLLAVIAFWSLEGAVRAPSRAGARAAIAGLLTALAGLARSIGFVWIPAMALLLALQRRRAVIPYLLLAVPPAAAWLAWSSEMRPENIPPLFYHYVDYGSWWRESIGSGAVRVIGLNILWAFHGLGDAILPGLMIGSVLLIRTAVWAWAILGALVGARALRLARAGRAMPWMLASYFVPVILWPWPPGRFWIPMAPFAAGLLVSEAASFWRRRWPNRMRLGLDLAFAGMFLNLVYLMILHQETRTYRYPIAVPGLETPHRGALDETFAWIRVHTPADAIVAAALDPMVWLYTGRRSFRYYNQQAIALFYDQSRRKMEDPDELLANLRTYRATYLLDAPLHNFAIGDTLRAHVASLARRRRSPLDEVFRSRDGEVRVYRVLPAGPNGRAGNADRWAGGRSDSLDRPGR